MYLTEKKLICSEWYSMFPTADAHGWFNKAESSTIFFDSWKSNNISALGDKTKCNSRLNLVFVLSSESHINLEM